MTRLDFYYSFRSPYSYLAFQRVFDLADDLGLDLHHRPIRPMVTRGVKLSRAKAMYIVADCKRIAESLEIPFGPIADPLGEAVHRCLGVSQFAQTRGRIEAFVLRASRAIWAEGRDLAEDSHFERICEESGLDFADCKKAVAEPAYREQIECNVSEHARLHWGVPLMVVGNDDIFWGQDRIDSLRTHLLEKNS